MPAAHPRKFCLSPNPGRIRTDRPCNHRVLRIYCPILSVIFSAGNPIRAISNRWTRIWSPTASSASVTLWPWTGVRMKPASIPTRRSGLICRYPVKRHRRCRPLEEAPGLGSPEPARPGSAATGEDQPATKGQKTSTCLFQAAEKVFGSHGVNHANISEITREAGVAQGTFYIHFNSKNDLVEGFVRYINHNLRREVQRIVRRTAGPAGCRMDGHAGLLQFPVPPPRPSTGWCRNLKSSATNSASGTIKSWPKDMPAGLNRGSTARRSARFQLFFWPAISWGLPILSV